MYDKEKRNEYIPDIIKKMLVVEKLIQLIDRLEHADNHSEPDHSFKSLVYKQIKILMEESLDISENGKVLEKKCLLCSALYLNKKKT